MTNLSRMGSPMARRLLRAGFPLIAGKRTAPRELLPGDGGAAVVESPAEDGRPHAVKVAP